MAYIRKKDGAYYNPADGRIYEHRGYSTRLRWSKQMTDDLKRMYPVTTNKEMADYLGVSESTLHRKVRELGLQKDPAWLKGVWDRNRKWAHMSARYKGYPGTWKPGRRVSPATEFRKGHQLTDEQKAKKAEATKLYWRHHPREARQKALKAWETRRRRMNADEQDNVA